MELRLLRDFLAVIEHGSVGTAARALGLSQPALSKAIHSLEASLGAPLFERTVTGATPTAIGRALEPHAREILNGARRAEREIAEMLDPRRGRVAVISGSFFAELLYPTVLHRFHETHPQVEVVLSASRGEGILGAVRANEAEIAFTLLDYAREDDVLATDTLVTDQRIIVVAGPSHPLARRRRVTPREAWDYPWLLPRQHGRFRARLAERFQGFGLPLPAPVSISASAGIQKHILRGGSYLGVLPELGVREELVQGTLCAIQVPGLGWTYGAGAFYRKSIPLSPAARHFIEIARGVCRAMAANAQP